MREVRIVVVGGANTDIVGRSAAPLVARDSNPGHVAVSAGGVGRNIAENLARMGARVELVTAFGSDHNAAVLRAECDALGIGTRESAVAEGLPGSVYVALLGDDGDMALAMNDMRALDALDPDRVESALAELSRDQSIDVIVLDANPSAEVVRRVASFTAAPVVVDPVSAAKAPKVEACLEGLSVLKCNALEAATLAGADDPATREEVEALAETLRARGVDTVYITTAAGGVHHASARETGWEPAPCVEVVNATGAGDAFTAGVAYGTALGLGAAACASLGSALAARALGSEDTVSDRVTPALVESYDKERAQ